jgi:hypothetical protein
MKTRTLDLRGRIVGHMMKSRESHRFDDLLQNARNLHLDHGRLMAIGDSDRSAASINSATGSGRPMDWIKT